MAILAKAPTGGIPRGATVAPPGTVCPLPPGAEAPEGAAKVAKVVGAKNAGGAKVAAAQAVRPANLPPGAEWEAPEGVKAAKVAKAANVKATTVAKGAATTNPVPAKAATGTLAAGKGATGKSLIATGTMATGKGGLAAAPNGVAVKGVTAAGSSFWSGGLSGLGISLGGWGPVLVVGTAAAVGIGIYSYMKNKKNPINELEDAIS
ncbi:MAG: hypothetical protein HQL07_14570 [Nitrospirae bacterium]|nr:hypothetical protein [Magnetococcales bacterium]HAT50219.1 hypothetical protein [Alphaproteobacteria bacterium]